MYPGSRLYCVNEIEGCGVFLYRRETAKDLFQDLNKHTTNIVRFLLPYNRLALGEQSIHRVKASDIAVSGASYGVPTARDERSTSDGVKL
jgi:hypothetical protein